MNNKLKLAIDLVLMSNSKLSDKEICNRITEEFGLECTQHNINVYKASIEFEDYTIESRKIKYYG